MGDQRMSYPEMTKALLTRCGLDAGGVEIVWAELERLNAELEAQKDGNKQARESNRVLTQAIMDWEPVQNHINASSEPIGGRTTPETALAWLRERDALKSQLAALKAQGESLSEPEARIALAGRLCDRSCRHPKD